MFYTHFNSNISVIVNLHKNYLITLQVGTPINYYRFIKQSIFFIEYKNLLEKLLTLYKYYNIQLKNGIYSALRFEVYT